MTNRQAASIVDAFERALGEILVRVSASAPRIAVAFSGGLDSTVLLHLAASYARSRDVELFAFHVHHGLSENADAWLAHCEHECAALGVRFDVRRVSVQSVERHGIEQAARLSRYSALGELCRLHGATVLLTAHHQDDQAETVLLQLLRGAGLPGLSGMSVTAESPALLGASSPVLARPLLDVSRAELEGYISRCGVRFIRDESNDDVRYSRNALRHTVATALAEHFPGYQKRLARAARHAQSAQRLLNELATQDWQMCGEGEHLVMERFAMLGEDRQLNLLRYWFARHRIRMPGTAWLDQMRAQLLGAREDAQVRVVHPDCEVRRHRGRACLVRPAELAGADAPAQFFRWQGEASIRFPTFRGELFFESVDRGISADWLKEQPLQIRHRKGGEKLKPAADRPTRSLKHHYQELDISIWERQCLPVVLSAGRLVFAAGIGMNYASFPESSGKGIRLRWEKEVG